MTYNVEQNLFYKNLTYRKIFIMYNVK